jgi:ATP-dependent Clp protease ATP-binding subunit ClpX
MYDVPSSDDVAQVIINAEVVKESALPTLLPREKLAKRERREKSA